MRFRLPPLPPSAHVLAAACLATLALAQPALANPPRTDFREPIADYHDKELFLNYSLPANASVDFALLEFLAVGGATDSVVMPRDWNMRASLKLLGPSNGPGPSIALMGGATRIQPLVDGQIQAPVWGYDVGVGASFTTEVGVGGRLAVYYSDTDWNSPWDGIWRWQPEAAFRYGLLELYSPLGGNWVGLRLRF